MGHRKVLMGDCGFPWDVAERDVFFFFLFGLDLGVSFTGSITGMDCERSKVSALKELLQN